jgi:hypothetical protein
MDDSTHFVMFSMQQKIPSNIQSNLYLLSYPQKTSALKNFNFFACDALKLLHVLDFKKRITKKIIEKTGAAYGM